MHSASFIRTPTKHRWTALKDGTNGKYKSVADYVVKNEVAKTVSEDLAECFGFGSACASELRVSYIFLVKSLLASC